MSRTLSYAFYGDQQRRTDYVHPDSPKEPEPYIASDELIKAVNLAIYLRRPLLLEGEAGCGKTRLARAVAYELGLPFYPWYVLSTSKAQEGLYEYDAILRLHDVQVRHIDKAAAGHTPPTASGTEDRNPQKATDYRRLGPLGKAFDLEDVPAVVLIDEIDKADVDFPNDLLTVLDDPWEFKIPETNEVFRANHKPVVIITSNKEKGNLPAPFLRRCIYNFIEFPDDKEQLKKIVAVHYQNRDAAEIPTDALTTTAVQRFLEVRQTDSGLHKKPGTSEFLDWLDALHNFALPHYQPPILTADTPLPYPGLLFKLRADWQRYINL
jgi:MoxR-like ATPase